MLAWLFSVLVWWPGQGLAEEPSSALLAEARAWYRDGLSLEAAGNWAQALARFERVATVRFTAQVRFHVARCKEHLGRMTEALGDYRISEYEAERDALPELSEIRAARHSLESRLPKLSIHRGRGAEQATISLDGVTLGEVSIGTELAIDPGPHHLHARSPGKRDFERTVELREGARDRIDVTLDPLPVASGGAPPPAPQGGREPARLQGSGAPWPWVAGGVAVASAGAGTYFLIARSRAIDVQKEHCVGRVCNQDFRGAVESAEKDETRNGRLAVAAFALSGLAAGAAVTLWAVEGPGQGDRAGRLRLHATASDRELGVVVRGGF